MKTGTFTPSRLAEDVTFASRRRRQLQRITALAFDWRQHDLAPNKALGATAGAHLHHFFKVDNVWFGASHAFLEAKAVHTAALHAV